jgi:hypothetical protein
MSPRHDTESRFSDSERPSLGSVGDVKRRGFSSPRARTSPPWHRWAFQCAGVTLLFAALGVGYAWWTRPFQATVQLFAYEKTFSSQADAADFAAGATSTGSIAKLILKLPKDVSTQNLAERCEVIVDQGRPLHRRFRARQRPEINARAGRGLCEPRRRLR